MAHSFDKLYWDKHYGSEQRLPVTVADAHPYLQLHVAGLPPGTALEAGCGRGAEAMWLAAAGWDVTAVDMSSAVLEAAQCVAARLGLDTVRWLQADLTEWEPEQAFDLVSTHYAHASVPQLAFYDRLAGWVKPGGTLLIVGHLHHGHRGQDADSDAHARRYVSTDGGPPPHASVRAADVAGRLAVGSWRVESAEEVRRIVAAGRDLHDVVVRATRLA